MLDKIKKYLSSYDKIKQIRIFTDTTDFFKIDVNDVIDIGGKKYLIRGNEYEGRFGLEDPKYWVKKAIDIDTGEKKILKLVFSEIFEEKIGQVKIKYVRSPEKEARILDIVRGHKNFVHGFCTEDNKGNKVRILDRIEGISLYDYISYIKGTHEEYFYEYLPDILKSFLTSLEAIRFLHQHGEKHADIRSDHIIIERNTNIYKWIDFDLDYDYKEKPFGLDIAGIGSLLNLVIGKGIHTLVELKNSRLYSERIFYSLTQDDLSPVFPNRVMNLRKIFPYIPEMLNNILLHFSAGAKVFYETVDEIIWDLAMAIGEW